MTPARPARASPGVVGDVTAARAAAGRESILRRLGRPPRQPFLLFLSASATGPPADDPGALALLHGQWRPLLGPEPWSHAPAALGLGLTWLLDGQIEPAPRELIVALDRFRAVGDRW